MLRRARADDLAPLTVQDEHGAATPLGTLWRERTAVLVFTRHFGCIHCRSLARTLERDGDRIRAHADLHVIGNGAPTFIAGFRDATGYRGPVYTDPSLAAFRAAGLERGVMSTFDPRGFGKALRSLASGQKMTILPQGDEWQQGGVLVIAPSGEILWRYVSRRAGDDPAVEQIVRALTQ